MSRYGRGALGTAAGVARAAFGPAPASGKRIPAYQSSFAPSGLTAGGAGVSRRGIHQLCLDYFHFLALYYPEERGRLGEALVTYTNAGPDLIDQCALELSDEIRKVAAARGVRPQDIKREFKELKKTLPTDKVLNKMRAAEAEPVLVSAYARLGYPTPEAQAWYAKTTTAAQAGDAVAMAELDESVPGPSQTTFGAFRLRWPRPLRPASGRVPRWFRAMQKAAAKHQRQAARTARRIAKGKAGKGVSMFGWTP